MWNNHQADFLCWAVTGRPIIMPHSWASSIVWLLAMTICTGEDVIRGTLTMSHICTRAVPQGSGTIIPLSPPSLPFPSIISWYSCICSFFIFKRSALLPPPQTCQNQFAPLLSLQTNFTVTSSCLSPLLQIFSPLHSSVKTMNAPLTPHLLNKSSTFNPTIPSCFTLSLYLCL